MGQVAYRRGQRGRGGPAADPGLRRRPQQSRRDAPAGRGVSAGRADRPDAGGADPAGRAGPADASNHCLLGLSYSLGGDPAAALPSHRRAVELDPRSTICRVCAAVALTAAGRDGPRRRSSSTGWSASRRTITWRRSALRFRRGLAGDRAAVLSPLGAAERAMAESDEYWSYLMAAAYALVGEDDRGAAAGWSIRSGAGVDRLRVLHPARPVPRELAADPAVPGADGRARERYARFTDDGGLTAHRPRNAVASGEGDSSTR